MKTILSLSSIAISVFMAFTSCSNHGTPDQQVRVKTHVVSPRGSDDLPSVLMRNVDTVQIIMGDNAGDVSGITASYKTSETDGDVTISGEVEIANTKRTFENFPADSKVRTITFDDKTRVIISGTRIDRTGRALKLGDQTAVQGKP